MSVRTLSIEHYSYMIGDPTLDMAYGPDLNGDFMHVLGR